ncbi:MAG: dihydroorotase [Chitinophagales bacterium]|nr:dihydroorotase [Chitinophagales bacterium]
MKTYLIKNAQIVNEGKILYGDVLLKGGRIEKIEGIIDDLGEEIDATGQYLLPGAIDDQVHFREPGLTHKGNIYTESRAAVAGGITSYMEMPNTQPPALSQALLADKYAIATESSLANYSFFMGTSNTNYEEVMKTDLGNVCGLKIFMGSSTGNLLVDDDNTLRKIFANFPGLIATHCEDEQTIKDNLAKYRNDYGAEEMPAKVHPLIRNSEACYKSSAFAVGMAKEYGTRLHVLHISTAIETQLFDNTLPLEKKHITAEACIHHLWFTDEDYAEKGFFIKWNPAIKTAHDRTEIWNALLDGRIDVIATDHAPHTYEEKLKPYEQASSGGPLVQHALVAMMEKHRQGRISLEHIVEKMCHNPAILFRIPERGFIREGYKADLVLVNPNQPWTVSNQNILYKCKWSPFEGQQFHAAVTHTWVSGHLAYRNGAFDESRWGERLRFRN